MTSFENKPQQFDQFNPWSSLLIFVLLFIVATVVSQLIAGVVGILVANVPLDQITTLLAPPYGPESKKLLFIIQGISHFLGFTLFGLIYASKLDRQSLKSIFEPKRFTLKDGSIAVLLTFFFMLFNSIIIEWNMNIEFPEFLSEFEAWARKTEDDLMALTNLLSSYDNLAELMVALLVIGVLPAIGEELIFRGLLQNKIASIAKNPHVAIWVAAIIFGAFHLQFYGVVPRILLGAVFGYLYYYSGSLLYAILAHFVNNGLAVIIMYIGPRVDENWDPQAMDEQMPLYVSLGALVLFLILAKKFIDNRRLKTDGQVADDI